MKFSSAIAVFSLLCGVHSKQTPNVFGVIGRGGATSGSKNVDAALKGLNGGAIAPASKAAKPVSEKKVVKSALSPLTSEETAEDKELMDDIEFLHGILAEIVDKESPHVHKLFTEMTKHGATRAADPNDESSFDKMKQLARDISPHNALSVLRVFSLALNLVNSAEVNHRLRLMRRKDDRNKEGAVGPLPQLEDGMRGTIDLCLASGDATKDQIYNQLLKQKVELVLTAHPTEVNRQTILRRYRRITETLCELDRPDLHQYQRSELLDRIRRDIAAAWGSDEIRRRKPTPQLEARGAHAVVESVLWEAVPAYLRKLDQQCKASLGKSLPIDAVPIKFASWIGGDRDGNPNVTPTVTKEVVAMQRLRAAKLFLTDLDMLYAELAISSRYSKELIELADSIQESGDTIEKYRRIIGHLRHRLVKTIRDSEQELEDSRALDVGANKSPLRTSLQRADGNMPSWENIEPIRTSEELMMPLRCIYDSLVETGFEMVANGRLVDIIRRVSLFGVTLLPLDIREESTQHTIALDAITTFLGVGSYAEWGEEAKLSFLMNELSNKRPLFILSDLEKSDCAAITDNVLKTLRTFECASNLGSEALGAYVISQAKSASDVLAVMLLQRQFGMTPESGKMMRVVPLFETLNDLNNAPDVLTILFKMSQYVGAIKGKQEVMVGYSDSAKDAGRLAACWAQYRSQEKMVKIADDNNIELTFFHGKGGTVGRGGNPNLYRAILSHPPNTINGRFRVTEQGEMITQNFGSPTIAERNLDIYTAGVLREAFYKHVTPKESWRKQMERISDVSCTDYRKLVRDDPRFVSYFREATPELELGSLNLGSRPAKRNPKGGIESLRAIPWTFAWTQTRLHLSAWLGVGRGLTAEREEDKSELKEMYKQWPWFREIIDLITMILSKTDFSISENYDKVLVSKTKDHLNLGKEVRTKLVETRQAILDVSGSHEYGGPHIQLLRTSSRIRNPYVDAINCLQVELLKELRGMPEGDSEIKNVRQDALMVSIKGIARGLGNSG